MSTSIASELEKLDSMRRRGILTDEEFLEAKRQLLNTVGPANNLGTGVHLLGKAANRWIDYKIVTGIVAAAVAILAIFFIFIPHWQKINASQEEFNIQSKKIKEEIDRVGKEIDQRRK